MVRALMRRLVLLLLVPLCACPTEPPPLDCTRTLVDPSGNVNGGFGGGVGGGSGGTDAPLGLVGAPLTVTVFAPLSACAPDVLRADATLLDPDNAPLAFAVDRPVSRSGSQLAVSAAFTFTPRQPGLHTLRVAFEPSLGVRSVLVQVAADGMLGLTNRVPLPAGANCTVWPLSDDTVACAEESSGFVSVTSTDGGTTRFSGYELVVVDTVLWSIDGTTNTLERRVFEDGGLRVTNRLPGFPVMATPALHDVDVALRYRSSYLLTRVRVTPTSESLGDFPVERSTPALAYFVEPDDTLFRWDQTPCFITTCTTLTDLVGLEPGFLWRSGNGFETNGQLSAFERPLATPASPRFSLKRQTMFFSSPEHSFERLPVWLEPLLGSRRVLVSVEDGGLVFSSWPWAEVLTIGRRHAVLTDSPGFVRVIRR